ncbi:hypothetical protein DER46DRAFT_301225 [Fusarium sp. MPI-SDFR-AT-0072]|nr:hypothetical protein DER46DRAFT_301225 [Fusarium sp. MPI-SDFR-AT-0072]
MGWVTFFVLCSRARLYTWLSRDGLFFLCCIMESWAGNGMGWQALSGMWYYKIQPWDLLHGVPGGNRLFNG